MNDNRCVTMRLCLALTAWVCLQVAPPVLAAPSSAAPVFEDGHSRPRALLYQPRDRLLYVALSTANQVVAIDPFARPPRIVHRQDTDRFPQALAALPGGGVLVSCRFGPALNVLTPTPAGLSRSALDAGPTHGHRGLAVNAAAGVVYVASPPEGGVKVIALSGGVRQVLPTGLSPRALLLIDDPRDRPPAEVPRAEAPRADVPHAEAPRAGLLRADVPRRAQLLIVANFVGHTVTVHPVRPDGRLGPAVQTLATDAPVQEALVVPTTEDAAPELLLLTHEDRPLDRSAGPVAGLDSVVLALSAAAPAAPTPFVDPGPGRRRSHNLSERPPGTGLLAKLDAIAYDPLRHRLAIAGAATDNVLFTDLPRALPAVAPAPRALPAVAPAPGAPLPAGTARDTGASPVALAVLPDGRVASADRLSDTVSFLDPGRGVVAQVAVGPPRGTPAELGELLFYSRALVPHNVADGPLSVYACSACHDDGHIDGRRHPARKNRFRSMTKSCRGLRTTAPYLSLGEIGDLDEFADNIVTTHAQGEDRAPTTFDQYPVTLRLRGPGGWTRRTLSPVALRQAMARYLAAIPAEPSPFVPPGQTALPQEARAGLRLFQDRCTRCHPLIGDSRRGDRIPSTELERRLLRGQVALTSPLRYDVGTPVLGQGGNNPPSLRGVWDAAPLLNDGSAADLAALLRRTDPDADAVHAPDNRGGLSQAEQDALRLFLRLL